MLADFCGVALPSRSEVVNEDYEMRITHRDRNSADLAECQFDRKFIADLRLSHGDLKFERCFGVRRQRTCFDSSAGADINFASRILRAQVGRHTTGTIAGDFCLRPVRIEQARANVGILSGKEPLYAIGADSIVAVANSFAEAGEIGWRVHAVNDKEIIAAGTGFYERDCGLAHSGCTGPSAVTLSNSVESRRLRSTSDCCLRVPSHSKRMRT